MQQLIQHIQEAISSITPEKATVFHAKTNGRLIYKKYNFRRMKLHGMNQGSNFLTGNLSNREGEVRNNLNILKMIFKKNRPIHFITIAPELSFTSI